MKYFDAVFVLNLATRTDRKAEMLNELSKVNLTANQAIPVFFPAIAPTEVGDWPSLGAKGCFMSHLEMLKIAREKRYKNILVLEDDCEFSSKWDALYPQLMEWIEKSSWDMAFLGNFLQLPESAFLQMIPVPKQGMRTTHCLAFNSNVFDKLIDFLEKVEKRKSGDPLGGPQHYDGALNMFIWQHPEVLAFAAVPSLAFQRSSKSDVTPNWYDKIPVLKHLAKWARQFKHRYLLN